MPIDRLDRDAIDQQQREARQHAKLTEEVFRADVQHAMQQRAVRRILSRFLNDMMLDASPFATNAMAQSHAIGMQDAGKWWLNVIRAHCPEQEVAIRTEGAKLAQPMKDETDDN